MSMDTTLCGAPASRRDYAGEVDLKKLTKQANKLIAKRGGTAALKADAQELANIAKSKGTAADKAKAAAAALKQPGKNH